MYRVSSIVFGVVVVSCFGSSLVCAAENSWQGSLAQGDSYVSKRALPKAEQCFRQALLKLDQEHGTVEDKAKCLNSLANTLTLEDKTSEAGSTLFKLLNLSEQAYGKNSPKLIPTLFAIGSIYESVGNHALAMNFYSKAAAIGECGYGTYCPTFSSHLLRMDSSKKTFGITANSGLSGSPLKQPAELKSSEEMKNSLPMFSNDILKFECTSNEDLLSDFKHDTAEKENH